MGNKHKIVTAVPAHVSAASLAKAASKEQKDDLILVAVAQVDDALYEAVAAKEAEHAALTTQLERVAKAAQALCQKTVVRHYKRTALAKKLRLIARLTAEVQQLTDVTSGMRAYVGGVETFFTPPDYVPATRAGVTIGKVIVDWHIIGKSVESVLSIRVTVIFGSRWWEYQLPATQEICAAQLLVIEAEQRLQECAQQLQKLRAARHNVPQFERKVRAQAARARLGADRASATALRYVDELVTKQLCVYGLTPQGTLR